MLYVPDSGLGWAYTAAITLTDANDSPLSGAPSGGGTLNVYGPASATTIVHTASAGDLGNGDYGVVVPASVHSTAGRYFYTIPTITVGGYTFADQGGTYSVGVVPPEIKTYRAILVAVCEALGVGFFGRSTGSGSTTTLVDSRVANAGFSTNEFVGDELLLLEPSAVGDVNPVNVTAFTPGTGTYTFTPAVTSMASGRDYLLIRAGRLGLRYAQIREAIVAAVHDVAARQQVSDAVTLTSAYETRSYTIPSSWLDVKKVQVAPNSTDTDPDWEEAMPTYWEYRADRRQMYWKGPWLPQGLPLRLEGVVGVSEPRSLGGLVRVPWTQVRDVAVGYLSLPKEQRAGIAFRRAMTGRVR